MIIFITIKLLFSLLWNLVQKDRDREEKKRILPNLGERTLGNEEDPPEYIAGHTCSDEEVRGFQKITCK